MSDLNRFTAQIADAMSADQHRLRQQLRSMRRAEQSGRPFDRNLARFETQLTASVGLRSARRTSVPVIDWEIDLPVVQHRQRISEAIRDNQVVVVCGETGSGKSTQLPKIALELGRGVGGVIGHTQPRRIAARSIASRLAEELNCPLGQQVGYRIRFNDSSSASTLIRLMTDGILLAETQSDRWLDQYDTLIIDEAHERSLNIDFLLGYLKRLLPKRPDLKLIITSATIDAERFAEHFTPFHYRRGAKPPGPAAQSVPAQPVPDQSVSDQSVPRPSGSGQIDPRAPGPLPDGRGTDGRSAEQRSPDGRSTDERRSGSDPAPVPVITVEGRTYPVDVWYRPVDLADDNDEARDWLDGIVDAVDELAAIDNGHMLVFLPTERDIRDTAKRLGGKHYPGDSPNRPTEILPLFGRLSMDEQARVFKPYQHRRIVLATNVAESSLTVPGIRFVIDTGTARISRYSARSRLQRLPIEAVSQASARQRAGRCGRIGPGVCVRLYSEEDYATRDEFTSPEIQRTNLASVILRTASLKLGRIDEFPFLDPPRPTNVSEGFRTLTELGALDEKFELTQLGHRLARLPVDPRIGRIILAAAEENAMPEVLIIAAALELQDVRDRPVEKQQQADEAHAQFIDERSDFLSLLKIWDFFHEQKKALSQSKLRKCCTQNFISYRRMREWIDIHRQLRDLLTDSDDASVKSAAKKHPLKDRRNDFAAIHRSLMTGLLINLALRNDETGDYIGTNGGRLLIWPGSGLSRKKPRWILAAELIETTRRFARMIARIQPEWIEPIAGDLVKREYSEPRWDRITGRVVADERVTLWGLPIIPRRSADYGRQSPKDARDLFIENALVHRELLPPDETSQESELHQIEQQLRTTRQKRVTGKREGKSSNRDRHAGHRAFPFLPKNAAVLKSIEDLQARTRRYDLMPSDEWLFDFFDQQLPDDVNSRPGLKKWYGRASKRQPNLLMLDPAQLTGNGLNANSAVDFPHELLVGNLTVPLTYQLEPGTEADGITLHLPAAALDQLDADRLTWLVPGLLEERVLALIRSLPKALRRQFVPAPDTAAQVTPRLQFGVGRMENAVADLLSRIASERISEDAFDLSALPEHLRFNLRVLNDSGGKIAESRDLEELRAAVASRRSTATQQQEAAAHEQQWFRTGFVNWAFADVPERIRVNRAGMSLDAFPAIRDDGESVALTLCESAAAAKHVHRLGLRRLFSILESRRILAQVRNLPRQDALRVLMTQIRGFDWEREIGDLLADRAFLADRPLPRTQAAFEDGQKTGRNQLAIVVQDVVKLLPTLIEGQHEVRMSLEQLRGPGWDVVKDDIRSQLDSLIHPHFLSTTPWPWLVQFPRYLSAMRMRIKRLQSGGLKTERQLINQFSRFQDRYHERRARHAAQQRIDPMLDHFRWMLEEFRVSIFAQKLGTAISVSERKLNEHWQRVG